MRLRVYAGADFANNGIRLSPMMRDEGKDQVPVIRWRDHKPGAFYPDDAGFLLDEQAAQQLIDSLWDCGLRPTTVKTETACVPVLQAQVDFLKQQNTQLLGALLATKEPR